MISLVNNVQEGALRIVSGDHSSTDSELLATKNEPTIHLLFISKISIVLMKEIYKFKNDLSLPLIDDMFKVRKINYNLRHFQKTTNTKKKSVKMSLKTIYYRAL